MMPIQKKFFEIECETWQDLKMSDKYGLPYGEETITENFFMDLKKFFLRTSNKNYKFVIVPFNKQQEGKNGADWAWCFESYNDWGKKIFFSMLIQAKKLNTKNNQYDSLFHQVKGSQQFQIDLLIKTAQQLNFFPAYVFYNYSDSVQHAKCRTNSNVKGVGMSIINALYVKHAQSQPNPLDFDTYFEFSKPLHCIFCRGNNAFSELSLVNLVYRNINGYLSGRSGSESNIQEEQPTIIREVKNYVKMPDGKEKERFLEKLIEKYPTISNVVIFSEDEKIQTE